MGVTKDDVRRIAQLARIRPDDRAIERLTGELNGILEHVRVLEEVDVSQGPDPAALALADATFRDPTLERDPLAVGAPGRSAPGWRDGFFTVPRLPALDGGDEAGDSGSSA